MTFGARSRLRPPSGADLRVDESFTARLNPAGPTVPRCWPRSTSVSACPPGSGSRSRCAARPTGSHPSSRPAWPWTGSRCWTSDGQAAARSSGAERSSRDETKRRTQRGTGWLRAAVRRTSGRHRGRQSQQHTARLHRRGGAARSRDPARGSPGRRPVSRPLPGTGQRLLSPGRTGRRRAGPRRAHGGAVVLPHLARRGPMPDGGAGRRPGRGLGAGRRRGPPGERHLVAWPGRALPWPIRRPGARDRALVLRGGQLGQRRLGHPGCPAARHPGQRRPRRHPRGNPGRRRAA